MLRGRTGRYFRELSWAQLFLLKDCEVRGWNGDLKDKGSRAMPGLKTTVSVVLQRGQGSKSEDCGE